MFRRTLPRRLIAKALTVLTLATLLVLVGTLALMVSDELSLHRPSSRSPRPLAQPAYRLASRRRLSAFAKVLVGDHADRARGPLVLLWPSRPGRDPSTTGIPRRHSPWLATSAKYARTRGRQVRGVRLVSTRDSGFGTALYGFLDADLIEDPTGRLR